MLQRWTRWLALPLLIGGSPAWAVDAPVGLAGCSTARDEPAPQPEETFRTYNCASGVVARIWIKPGGWPDAEAAFAEMFARAAKIAPHWIRLDDRTAWRVQKGSGTIDLVSARAVEARYRSLRGGHTTWAVPAGPRPGVLFETTSEISKPAAGLEATRVLELLIAETRWP